MATTTPTTFASLGKEVYEDIEGVARDIKPVSPWPSLILSIIVFLVIMIVASYYIITTKPQPVDENGFLYDPKTGKQILNDKGQPQRPITKFWMVIIALGISFAASLMLGQGLYRMQFNFANPKIATVGLAGRALFGR